MKEQPNLDGIIAAPFGYVGWQTYRQALVAVEFPKEPDSLRAPESATGRQVRDALLKYFGDPDAEFNIQLACRGTAFQMRVWNALRKIPRGEVVTYGELADSLETSPRPVAGACRANPLPIVIPCHRVLASDGIGGYAGATGGRMLAIKRWLLTHEGALATEPEQRAIEL